MSTTPKTYICEDELRIVYDSKRRPQYMRDRSGVLFTFRDIIRFQGQDDRYQQEVNQQHALADYLFEFLNKARHIEVDL